MTAAVLPFPSTPPLDARQRAQLLMQRAAQDMQTHSRATGDWECVFIAEALQALAHNQPGAALAVVRSWSLLRQGGTCRTAAAPEGAP